MTEKEAIERIHSVYPTGCKNGLENMRALTDGINEAVSALEHIV